MKQAIRWCGLCACGTFAVLSYTIYFNSMQPLRVLMVSVPGAVLCGLIGYWIGHILDHPDKRGRRRL